MLNIVLEKCLIILSLSFVSCSPSEFPTNSLMLDDPKTISFLTLVTISLSVIIYFFKRTMSEIVWLTLHIIIHCFEEFSLNSIFLFMK